IAASFDLIPTDSRQFGVGKHAEGDEAIAVGPIAAAQVRVNNAVVVEADVRELRTPRAIAHRPDAFRGCFQPLVSLDLAAVVELNAHSIEVDPVAVCLTAGRDEKIGALKSAITARVVHIDSHMIAGTSLDPASLSTQQDLDSFIDEQILERCGHISIFPTR